MDAIAAELGSWWGPLAAENRARLGLDVQISPADDPEHRTLGWAYPQERYSRAVVPIPAARPGERRPLWLATPLEARTTGPVVVVSDPASLSRWVRTARIAWKRIEPWMDRPARPITVEIAPDNAALTAALAGEAGEFAEAAAVTSTPDGSAAADAPIHVFLDASQARPGSRAAAVLLAHELVHALTRSPLHPEAPIWWREGYADYVAFAAGGIRPAVAEWGLGAGPRRLPHRLPSDPGFEQHPAWAYPAARTAVAILVDQGMPGWSESRIASALARIDQRLSGGEPVGEVLAQESELNLAGLTRSWRKRLQHWRS